jgi:hypothetical protein
MCKGTLLLAGWSTLGILCRQRRGRKNPPNRSRDQAADVLATAIPRRKRTKYVADPLSPIFEFIEPLYACVSSPFAFMRNNTGS